MPFSWTDATETAPSASTLRVDPDQVLRLKAELQPIHDEVETFLNHHAPYMTMQPLGADAVSYEAADVFNENAQAAIDAAFGYLNALKGVLDALHQATLTYDLVEDTNAQSFRQALR